MSLDLHADVWSQSSSSSQHLARASVRFLSCLCRHSALFLAFALMLTVAALGQPNCLELLTNAPEIDDNGNMEALDGDPWSLAAGCYISPLTVGEDSSSRREDYSRTSELTSPGRNQFTMEMLIKPEPVVASQVLPQQRFHVRSALRQSFEFLMLQHAFRIADDPGLRYTLAHSTFFHNWFASYKGYDLGRWGDGDDFLVNDIGHPLQGAVASRIFIQNSPGAGSLQIGKNHKYWTNRLKGMAWAAAFEVQWKVGPLSETSIGNAGGWFYVPGCGIKLSCLNDPKDPKPPTNNTGLSDWVLTPVVGMGWVMLEDTLDKYVVAKVAENHAVIGGKILRTALEPSRSFAGLFMGKLPWQWPIPENHLAGTTRPPATPSTSDKEWKENRKSVGVQFTSVTLPGVRSDCIGCRSYNSGIGFNYSYRILRNLFFDSEVNLFPTGASNGGPTVQGLFGTKFGHQGKNWGLFGKFRPGFIYYEKAWPGGDAKSFDSLSRLAVDTGGVFEVYPSRSSTLRFDVGTTLVRYLRDYPNPRLSPLGSMQSTEYYVNQGNFQISSGYTIRF